MANRSSLVKIKPLLADTYLAIIKNSVGAKSFCNFYALSGRRKIDIMQNGDLSCAFFVSSILKLFDLAGGIHGTVDGTITDLKKNGWYELKNVRPGTVIVWKELAGKSGEQHKHIGFCVGKTEAVSNSSKKSRIVEHHITFGSKNGKPARPIIKVFGHKKLASLRFTDF